MITSLKRVLKSRTVRSMSRSPPRRRKALFSPIRRLRPPERMIPVMSRTLPFHRSLPRPAGLGALKALHTPAIRFWQPLLRPLGQRAVGAVAGTAAGKA
jgi:hypothetical protein